jgi:catechol 2,3-dioxygenase-like lactoylglutathione lyase family enzyme
VALELDCVTVDCAEPEALAAFWAAALGGRAETDADGDVVLHLPGGGTPLLFLAVPEAKTTKNRLHFDLRPDDQAAEVARLEGLGARRAAVGQDEDAVRWVVMADPEGNEFCVLAAKGGTGGA